MTCKTVARRSVSKWSISSSQGRLNITLPQKVVELEIQLDEIKEQYNNVIRNSNSKAQQKKMVFLERNLEQLTIVQKQLVDQNSALKKEAGIAERKLLARNERIHNLEGLLQEADRRLVAQNHKFEDRMQSMMQLLEEARSKYSFCGKQDHRTRITSIFHCIFLLQRTQQINQRRPPP